MRTWFYISNVAIHCTVCTALLRNYLLNVYKYGLSTRGLQKLCVTVFAVLKEDFTKKDFLSTKKKEWKQSWIFKPEPVLLNVYGAPELIPRNEFRQPM